MRSTNCISMIKLWALQKLFPLLLLETPLCSSLQLSFTCGDTGIAISKKAMELGGKDACNVFEDADLDLGSLKLKDITP
ncbi:NADP-dependent glyceraldehyde-3-phosphate dehydrogenase [Arachis hypogaea]|nr:NADP-dependent glyceraldehyde-3-phosphate dehydrogenase [Arachis hypogaea]